MLAVFGAGPGEVFGVDANIDFGIEEVCGLGACSRAWLWVLLSWPSLSVCDIVLGDRECWRES